MSAGDNFPCISAFPYGRVHYNCLVELKLWAESLAVPSCASGSPLDQRGAIHGSMESGGFISLSLKLDSHWRSCLGHTVVDQPLPICGSSREVQDKEDYDDLLIHCFDTGQWAMALLCLNWRQPKILQCSYDRGNKAFWMELHWLRQSKSFQFVDDTHPLLQVFMSAVSCSVASLICPCPFSSFGIFCCLPSYHLGKADSNMLVLQCFKGELLWSTNDLNTVVELSFLHSGNPSLSTSTWLHSTPRQLVKVPSSASLQGELWKALENHSSTVCPCPLPAAEELLPVVPLRKGEVWCHTTGLEGVLPPSH